MGPPHGPGRHAPRPQGRDFADLPVLLKARGKCTTDHISPVGSWLCYRGHLERISGNMFLGARNAFTEEPGKVVDQLTGAVEDAPAVARAYKAQGLRWVVVGDDNYGEGSSREHAAMSPRFLGCAAVLARSFARIHETNLKKQGVLALTFEDPADYDKVRAADRVSLLGLQGLAPGKPVQVRVKHKDGSVEDFAAQHTLSAEQVAWFKAGSALNHMRKARGA